MCVCVCVCDTIKLFDMLTSHNVLYYNTQILWKRGILFFSSWENGYHACIAGHHRLASMLFGKNQVTFDLSVNANANRRASVDVYVILPEENNEFDAKYNVPMMHVPADKTRVS